MTTLIYLAVAVALTAYLTREKKPVDVGLMEPSVAKFLAIQKIRGKDLLTHYSYETDRAEEAEIRKLRQIYLK